MALNEERLALEEKRRRFYAELEAWARGEKPKPTPVVMLPVSEKIAQAAKANPESVRVSARGDNGIAIVEGPRRNSANVTVLVDYVREVDAEGRPVWDRPGAVHEYNPFSRL